MSGGTVLVTGGGGFVGSAIVRRLAWSGACFDDGTPVSQVVALLQPDGSTERLDVLPDNGSWSIERADLLDPVSLRGALDTVHPRAIIHAALDAAAYNVGDERLIRIPLDAIIENLRGRPDSRVIHVGSAWVLRQGDRLTESAPLAPLTPYASNKAIADRLLRARADRAGVQWINLRLFNVFGRYERPTRLLPTLVSQLARGEVARLTHGTQVRDFTDVDVAAGAFVAALAAPRKACSALYHIGSGQGTTVREFALAVADVVGSRGLIRFGSSVADDADIPCLVADPSRAIEAIGWTPDLDLRTRIAEAVDWWLRQLKAETTGKVMA